MCKEAELPSTLLAFLLFSNARLDGSQRVSILASVSSNFRASEVAYSGLQSASTIFINNSSLILPSAVINQLEYDALASVMGSSDQGRDKLKVTNYVFSHLVKYQLRKTLLVTISREKNTVGTAEMSLILEAMFVVLGGKNFIQSLHC